jgi:acetylornithine deacetylase
MKGSLACMLSAVDSIGDAQLSRPLYVVCTADEEVGLQGARDLAARSEMYREIVDNQCRAIIGEPTLLEVVHAHKGGRAMKITAKGRAAHSSTNKGRNANMDMIPFLAELRELCLKAEADPDWQDQRFDPPTISMNIGVNDFSYALNITPPQSVCTSYFRVMPDQQADSLVQQIRELADRYSLTFEVLFSGEALYTDPDSDFIRDLLQLTDTSQSHTVAYGTDGSCFTEINRIAVLGPGDIRQAHTDDEWITLEQLQRGTDVYRRLIARWCLPAAD